jgi:hypothetical protein
MKTYTVARTVVYYFEVEAESEQEALAEVAGLGGSACVTEDLVTEEIIYIEETV